MSPASEKNAPCASALPTGKQRNIVLIGMPGVGKTTIAKRLMRAADMEFLDTDRVIEAQCGKKISELVAENGAEGFISLENRICAGIDTDNCVIATGGSVVYGEDAMRHLSEIGTVVYLKLAFPLLKKRLDTSLAERGVVLRHGQTFYDLYRERVPLYEKYADIVIDERTCYPTQTAERVYRALRRFGFFRGKAVSFLPHRALFSQNAQDDAASTDVPSGPDSRKKMRFSHAEKTKAARRQKKN
ncbi:MAG: shikimate kinase [Clostridia bacterium]|nr:shikimate kinase [Clostridia bacterium]